MTDTVLVIPTRQGHAFGILSRPASPSGLAAVVLPSAGDFKNAHPFFHSMSHDLASAGITSLRIDYIDYGESSGGLAYLAADDPRPDEVTAAVAALVELGHPEVVLIGHCYGASVALAGAQLRGVVGVVLLSPPSRFLWRTGTQWTVGRLARGASRPRNWLRFMHRSNRAVFARVVRRFVKARQVRQASAIASSDRAFVPGLMRGIERLHQSGIPGLVVFGEEDDSLEFLGAEGAAHPNVAAFLAGDLPFVHTTIIPGSVHYIRGEHTASSIMQSIAEWTHRTFTSSRAPDVASTVVEQRV